MHSITSAVIKSPNTLTFPFAFGKVDMSFVVIDVSADWGHMSCMCFVRILCIWLKTSLSFGVYGTTPYKLL